MSETTNIFALKDFPASAQTVKPVTDEEFAALMKPFDVNAQPLALAVSGGPDSMALAWCVARWNGSTALRGGAPVKAFIVNHALRPESAEEAEQTKKRLEEIGLETEILRWDHPPVTTRIHVQARKARYDLLIEACKRHGIRHLLLAHQREDQAETILMRFAKGSGIDGLAGMAPTSTIKGITLVRPFLNVSKERLIATCQAAILHYATDPSNEKEKYARARLRRLQQTLSTEGFTTERLLDLGDRAREAKDALDHYTKALLRVAAQQDEAGSIRLNLEQLRSAPQAVALRALTACLRAIHEADYPPERASLLPVYKALCADEPMETRTLHGCVLGKTDKHVTFCREFSTITDEQPIEPGQTVLWDQRWHVTLEANQQTGLVVRALGFQTKETLDRLAPYILKRIPQGRVRAALPALWKDKTLAIIPSLWIGSFACAQASLKPSFWA